MATESPLIMVKMVSPSRSFIFDRIIIKVAGNQNRHKSLDEFDFGPLVSMAYLHVFLKQDLTLAHWTKVSNRCPFGYLSLKCFETLRSLFFNIASFYMQNLKPLASFCS